MKSVKQCELVPRIEKYVGTRRKLLSNASIMIKVFLLVRKRTALEMTKKNREIFHDFLTIFFRQIKVVKLQTCDGEDTGQENAAQVVRGE